METEASEWKPPPSTHKVPYQGSLEFPDINASSTVKNAPKFSFGARTLVPNSQAMAPGPGSYFESAMHRGRAKSPQFSFGAATRQEQEKNRVPGPGSYTHRDFSGGGQKSSITPRREITSIYERAPGPGSHDLRTRFGSRAPKHTITPRRGDFSFGDGKSRGPGPGEYASESVQSTSAKWGFGSAPQRPRSVERAESTPGPGSYRHDTKAYKSRAPKWTMRTRTPNDKVMVPETY